MTGRKIFSRFVWQIDGFGLTEAVIFVILKMQRFTMPRKMRDGM